MKKLRIFLGLFVSALMVVPFSGVSAMEKFTFDDWDAQSGVYGSATKVDDNITNMKGAWNEGAGMAYGPFTKKSQATLKDGVTEEVNVELNKENIADNEFFELSMAFNNAEGTNSDEVIVMTQRVGDSYILTSGKAPEFKGEISEDGIYTYRYHAYMEGENTYWEFTLLKDGEEVLTTGKVDLGVRDFETVRYIWFCNVQVEQGVNVYTNVPEKPATEDPTTPEEPENNPEETKPEEDVKDEVENPKTSDGIMIAFGLLAVSIVTVVIAKKKLA